MMIPPLPHDEAGRLQALADYCILDTEADADFDELTELVSIVLDVPIVLISLVDASRQWFKSRHGLAATETSREHSFCGHAILSQESLIVEDSLLDPRFADNPLVTGEPHVRFYAGAPLVTPSGHNIGTICAIDHEPRTLTPQQYRTLDIVSKQVVTQLELRKQIATKERLFQRQNRVIQQVEVSSQEVQDLVSVISHDLRAPVLNVVGFAEELEAGAAEIAGLISAVPSLQSAEKDRLRAVIEEDVIDSIVHLKRGAYQLMERVDAITSLSKHGRREVHLEPIDLEDLVEDIAACHSNELRKINGEVRVDVDESVITDRLSLQILLENLIGNAVKYRSADRDLVVDVRSVEDAGYIKLQVSDNGRGMRSEDVSRIFLMFRRVGDQDTHGDGTGLAFCRAITSRLGGTLSCASSIGEGSIFTLRLPKARSDGLADNRLSWSALLNA